MKTSLSLGTRSSCYNIKPKPRFFFCSRICKLRFNTPKKTKLGTGNTAQRKKENFKRNLPKPRYHVFRVTVGTYTNRQVTILHAKKKRSSEPGNTAQRKTKNFKSNLPKPRYHVFSNYTNRQVNDPARQKTKLGTGNTAQQGCGSGSGFNRVSGSGSGLRIQEGKNDPQK
jgi:hypothetical protein